MKRYGQKPAPLSGRQKTMKKEYCKVRKGLGPISHRGLVGKNKGIKNDSKELETDSLRRTSDDQQHSCMDMKNIA